MSTFTFLHEINDFIYAIRDCNSGTKDAVQRGEVIAFRGSAQEPASTVPPVFDMGYDIRFDGDTFTTSISVPFTVLSARFLTQGQTQLDFDQLTGSPQVADLTEGTYTLGSNYFVGDQITLSDGSLVTVTAVATSAGSPQIVRQVTGFTVTTASKQTIDAGDTLTQLAIVGGGGSPAGGIGVGFTLTPGESNLTFDGYSIQETTTDSTIFDNKADAIAAYSALLP